MLDKLYSTIMNRGVKQQFSNTDIYESPDGGNTVYVRKANQDPKFRSRVIINHDDPFIDELVSKGYTFDIANSWYRRRWTTNQGAESIEEVYQMLEHGEEKSWKHLMIGYGNKIFYEEPVEKVSHKGVGKDLDLL